jgi:hypothetical protein
MEPWLPAQTQHRLARRNPANNLGLPLLLLLLRLTQLQRSQQGGTAVTRSCSAHLLGPFHTASR